jgi:hypothetical protein
MGEIAADFTMNGSTSRDVSFLAPNRHLLERSTSSARDPVVAGGALVVILRGT